MTTMTGKINLTVSGRVLAVEKANGKTLWVAFVLEEKLATGQKVKLILSGQNAETALGLASVGSIILGSTSMAKVEDGCMKLFVDEILNINLEHL